MTRRQVLQRAAFPLAAAAALTTALVLRPPVERDVGRLARVEPLRPAAATGDPRFAAAMSDYAAGRWSEAAAKLGEAIAAEGDGWARRDEANLFLGSSLLLDSRPDAAAGALEIAARSADPSVSVRAKWCLAQAHLVDGDVAAARTLLDELSRTPAYARPASEMMLALSRLR
jgi:hypothetical protein